MAIPGRFTSNTTKPMILIFEVQGIITMDIAMRLQDLGYEPLGPARTGEQVISMAQRLRPTWF